MTDKPSWSAPVTPDERAAVERVVQYLAHEFHYGPTTDLSSVGWFTAWRDGETWSCAVDANVDLYKLVRLARMDKQ